MTRRRTSLATPGPRHLRLLLSACAATTLALTAPGAAGADLPAAAVRAAATTTTPLSLTFDGQDTFAAGTTVHDDAGAARGVVLTSGGGTLRAVAGDPGGAVQYPCATCGRAIIEVRDADSLDPGTAAFEVAADVRITAEQGDRAMNAVQKGFYNQAGGQYKLQVDYGQPSCVLNGSSRRIIVTSPPAAASIADGSWHHVACVRDAAEVAVLVDGVVRARTQGSVGAISNSAPVRIGGKSTSTDNDQYRATIDNVTIHITR